VTSCRRFSFSGQHLVVVHESQAPSDLRGLSLLIWSIQLEDSKDVVQCSDNEDRDPLLGPAISSNADSLLFGRLMLKPLVSSHPTPVQIFLLWQTCLDNVNPLLKLFHAPTVQQMILDAASNLENIPQSTEALMFAIYFLSITSLRNDDCERIMGESRPVLLARFSNATQQALINAELLKSSNMTVLQAFVLFLVSLSFVKLTGRHSS
jgi:hypothetical protein